MIKLSCFSDEALRTVEQLLFAEEENPLKGQCNQEKKREANREPRTPEQKQADAQRAQEMKGQDNVPSGVRQQAAEQAAKTRAKCKSSAPKPESPQPPQTATPQ